jgi:hypothetical protein
VHRDGVGQVIQTMQAIDEKLDSVAEGVQRIEGAILDIKERIEVVRQTMINLDAEQIPLIFTLALEPKDKHRGHTVSDGVAKSLFGRFRQMLERHNPLSAVQSHLDAFRGQRLKLQLLCQYTWEPVGDGFELRAPREEIPPLLPLLSVGVKGLRAVNTASAIGSVFLKGICPDQLIPEAVMADAQAMVDGLPDGLHTYPCVIELAREVALQGEAAGSRKALSHYQQQQFKLFLKTHDPDSHWRNYLRRVPLADGTVLWVSESGYRQLEEEGMLDSKGVKLQQELEDGITQAQRRFELKLTAELAKKEATMQQQIAEADDANEQQLAAELNQLREKHEQQRAEQEKRMEDARSQLAQLQKEKWNELLGVDADAAVSSGPNLVGEMERERLSVAERMAMAQGDESKKLRARLDARQQDRASKLLDAIIGDDA